ncbi:CLUMA_CG005558, isoform A, partial [Clunio marinus]
LGFNIKSDGKTLRSIKTEILEDQKLNLVRGQRGRPLLSHNGFLYAQNNKTQDSIYWCCRTKTRGEKPCRARITTTQKPNGLFRINITQPIHNHSQTSRIIKKLKAERYLNVCLEN